jgi:branched-chain amino acid transport system ATP-binding protein
MLQVQGISTFYDNREALKDLSLGVEHGEIVALIGGNGAGKSTALCAIAGLVSIASGHVIYAGSDITHLSAHEVARRGIALVPEGRRIFSRLTVLENLLMGAFRRRNARAVRRDLEYVLGRFPRLQERLRQTGGNLSGGEQQTLAMARALMSRPLLLLLDEPSMGLAPMLVRDIYAAIQALHEDGTTILLVEQNAHMALSVASRAYLMSGGTVVRSGPAEQMQHDSAIITMYLGGT